MYIDSTLAGAIGSAFLLISGAVGWLVPHLLRRDQKNTDRSVSIAEKSVEAVKDIRQSIERLSERIGR